MNNNELIPKIMNMLKFRGAMTLESIHYLTGCGKASIRNTLQAMLKTGIINKNGNPATYDLNDNSKYWLGWNQDRQWAKNQQ